MTTSEAPIRDVGGTQALIDKKDFFIVTTNFPEPSSYVLAMLGMVGMAMFVRRRSV